MNVDDTPSGENEDSETVVSENDKVKAAVAAIEVVDGDVITGTENTLSDVAAALESAEGASTPTPEDGSAVDLVAESDVNATQETTELKQVDLGGEASTQERFPPEPNFNRADDPVVVEHKPFPPEPRGDSRRPVWANGREYGSPMAAATALGISEEVLYARIASSEENYSTYRWAD